MFLFKYAFVLVQFMLFRTCFANFNFYLRVPEVQRLWGISVELYYVHDGILNEYATTYLVHVPASMNTLQFTWKALEKPLPYELSVDVSSRLALDTPYFNISKKGLIPMRSQTFSLTFPCTGHVTAEVDVVIYISVTKNEQKSEKMKIALRRRKICLKSDFGQSQNQKAVTVDQAVITQSTSANIFWIPLGCALALIAVIMVFIVVYNMENKKTRRQSRDLLHESRNGSNNGGQAHATFLSADINIPHNHFTGTSASSCKSATSYSSFRRVPNYSLIDERTKDLHERIAELTIQRCRVRLRSVVLEGTFGRVYQGSYSYSDEDNVEDDVIVKTVTDHASQVQISLLLQEGMTMYGLNHKNILSILGVSIEDHTAPFLIYPHNGYSNMKKFLQKCKTCPDILDHTLTTQEVVDMSLQVIHGMQYLHKKKLLHKDLATRNCVVDDKLRVQIADNALARDLFPSDYHCLGDNENRPVKWLAMESLVYKTFSTSSDVWAFGVLLWELTTLAQQPYVEIDPFEMAAYLKDGYRLAQPINCPDELFAIMAYCWAMSPDERPTFSQLQVCLQEFYTQLTRYV